MHLSLRGARRTTATAMTVALAAAGLLTSACTAQSVGNKVISGTIQGADGKYVDAYIAFAVVDSVGRRIVIGAGAGPSYSAAIRVNHCVATSGTTTAATCAATGYQLTKKWALTLPPNAARVFIEVYPQKPCYTNPNIGGTDTSTYGETYRDAISVPGNMANTAIVLPIVYGLPGGTTGTLTGHIKGWPVGVTGHVNAWAMTPNTLPTQGFAAGNLVDVHGYYRIDKLQSGQRYGLIAGAANGKSFNAVTYKNSTTTATLIPSAGAVKTYNFDNF
jgi:hypothetical protein